MKKSTTIKLLLATVFAAMFALFMVACSSGSGSASSASASASSEAASSAAASSEAATSAATVAKVDVSSVDFDVAAMSDEEAFAFMDEFINRTPDELDSDEGKVMHIKGQVSRYTKKDGDVEMVSDSVGIKGEGGVLKSVNFYVEGWTADDYPENKAQVEVTGVWGKVDGYGNSAGRTLICNPEDVKVL